MFCFYNFDRQFSLVVVFDHVAFDRDDTDVMIAHSSARRFAVNCDCGPSDQ